MCVYFITKNNGNKTDAEDVFQDTMLVLYKNVQQENFELTCSIKTYLYSIIRNLWLKELKKKNKSTSIHDYEKFVKVDDDETVLVEKNEQLNTIENAMQLLGENCRKILQLFYFEKHNMEQIAVELNYTNADNAKNQKYKCLQQLKKQYNAAE
jgi:RNA polymerase sigma factor (sigma-70 family)